MQVCDFQGSRPLGAPRDWDQERDGACSVLPVADVVDEQSGLNFMYSVWRPTTEQLAALNNGGAVRLGIGGRVHPVVNMAVLTPECCAASQVVEIA